MAIHYIKVRIETEDDKPFGMWEFLNDLEANAIQYFGADSHDAEVSGYLEEFAGVTRINAREQDEELEGLR